MVRKFLYAFAALIVLAIATLFVLRIWSSELTKLAMTPTGAFEQQQPLTPDAYDAPAMWISRPGMGANDPARWLPPGQKPATPPLDAAVFFIHPTTYLLKTKWNGPLGDAASDKLARTLTQWMASAFNASPEIWAPNYRQAAFGTFLSDDAAKSQQSIDLAYGDVLRSFDYFLAHTAPDKPIVLAGHSQGAFHLRRLLQERVSGKPLAKRIAAVYAIGWPISLAHDLPVMGLPACASPQQAGCVLSWLSYAEPAEPALFLETYGRRPGLDGAKLAGSPFLCTNPLTGGIGGSAPASANLGTLVPDGKQGTAKLTPAMAPARCGKDGFLAIGEPPELGAYVLPGNNYHVYDINLFWANVRADVARRVAAWKP